MGSRSKCAIAMVSGLHYVCCWATSFEANRIGTCIHTTLVLPLSPLIVLIPMDDPATFYMLMITNSVLWGLAVYLFVYVVLRVARGEFSGWIRHVARLHGRFSLLSLLSFVSLVGVEVAALRFIGFANWFTLHFVAALLLFLSRWLIPKA